MDRTLADRRRLLSCLASLPEAWPNRLLTACEAAQVYHRPWMVNFLSPPAWYGAVTQQVSRVNGRRPYRHTLLVAQLIQAELLRELDAASSSQERRRWEVLCRYTTVEEKLPVARALGYPFEFVHRTVTRYNAHGPAAMRGARQGQVNLGGRVLTPELEQDLRAALEVTPMTYAQMADWVEERTGHRPAPSTLWMYKRGVESHSREGRRAGQ